MVVKISYLSNEQKVSALRQSKSAGLVFRLKTDHALSLLALYVSHHGEEGVIFSLSPPSLLKKPPDRRLENCIKHLAFAKFEIFRDEHKTISIL